MFKSIFIGLSLVWLLVGCSDTHTSASAVNNGVDANDQAMIKTLILNGKNPPKEYRELLWQKLSCSDVIAQRLHKKALFVAHRFQERHIYGGEVTRENIYFIGDAKPSLIIDFNVKNAFEEFLENPSIQAIFAPSIWDLKTLHVKFQNAQNSVTDKETIKEFIYSIHHFAKEDQETLYQSIMNANTPMSIDKNVAIFMSMRLFPELMEELLFGEITYKGQYR